MKLQASLSGLAHVCAQNLALFLIFCKMLCVSQLCEIAGGLPHPALS